MSAANAVTIQRTIVAPVRPVFQAWTEGAQLQRWLAGKAAADGRVGGAYRLEHASDEGTHVVSGTYLEVAPERLVLQWRYQGPQDAAPSVETRVTVELLARGGSATLVRVTEVGDTLADANEQAFAKQAWTGGLEKLAELLERKAN